MSRNQMINSKFTSISRQSGEVSAALSSLTAPAAREAYRRIQEFEANAVSAGTAEQLAVAAAERATAALDAVKKQVRRLNSACVDICEVQGIIGIEAFAVMDKGDDLGLARRVEPAVRGIASFGPGLADVLAQMMSSLETSEMHTSKVKSHVAVAMRDLDAALLNLQSAVSQGKAVLASAGVKLVRKTKKVAATTNSPTLVPAPLNPVTTTTAA